MAKGIDCQVPNGESNEKMKEHTLSSINKMNSIYEEENNLKDTQNESNSFFRKNSLSFVSSLWRSQNKDSDSLKKKRKKKTCWCYRWWK